MNYEIKVKRKWLVLQNEEIFLELEKLYEDYPNHAFCDPNSNRFFVLESRIISKTQHTIVEEETVVTEVE